jgi:alpha-mannosidase
MRTIHQLWLPAGLAFLLLLLTSFHLGAQEDPNYFQGYQEEVQGKRFGYHSPFPEVNTSLLLRGRADYEAIAWKSEAVPDDYEGDFASFIWVFGMDVTAQPVTFHLSVNEQRLLSFESSRTSETGLRKMKGIEGSELLLNTTMLDKYEDQMGFAVLKVPVSALVPGEAALLKLEADPAGNNAWFMTFKCEVGESTKIYQNKVVLKKAGELYHSISADFIHVGEEETVEIRIGEHSARSILHAGYNKVEIVLPKVEKATDLEAEIRIGERPAFRQSFTLSPVREWEVFLVQHTHTDIGYTRPQTEILPEHLRYIDHALDYCDQTDHYPDAARFRWTCETSWSVREYLKSRPQAQIDRLLRRLQEGRIEATGMFFNFSEIVDEAALAAQTKTLRMFKNRGIEVNTAMQNDVNGIAWCLVDYYQHTDVKYLTMGIHAHRARKPFNKPTTFWWESPAGNRLMAYRSEHYQHGNALALTTGQEDVFRTNLSNYLNSLEARDYPYDKVSLQFSGYITDNSPPSTRVCDIVKGWNEKYEWPKLRTALAKDFLLYLDEYHAEDIETHRVAWPDWWTDGTASAANETKVARNTQVAISATTALLSMAQMLDANLPPNIQADIDAVYDNLLFYAEHTHGAAESVSDPLAQNSVNQWNMKAAYAWDAAKKSAMLQEKALAFLEPFIEKSSVPSIAVFNTLNWERSGMAEIFIDYETIPSGMDFVIIDEEGREVPVQSYERRQEGSYYGLWVEDIPPLGYKSLQIHLGHKPRMETASLSGNLENAYYRISIDPSKGIITQIFDKELGKNIVDPADTLTLGQFIYEELANRHDLERLTNTNRDTVYKTLSLKRSLLQNIEVRKQQNGPIYQSVWLHGDMPVCSDDRGINLEIRLYHHEKKIELHYQMVKLPVYRPEAVYIAFPFQLDGGQLAFEAQGGIVYPGKNQLAGSSADWNTIQNFAAVQNEEEQVVFVSRDIPLVHFGDINIGRYYYRLHPRTKHLFSWVLNNYWVTNFKASQQGELRWSYVITSSSDKSDGFATRFGWGKRVPLLTRLISPVSSREESERSTPSLRSLDLPNLLLVNLSPSVERKGVVLHLREIEGDHAILDIRRLQEETGARSIEEINILEEVLGSLEGPLLIEHYETKFIRLNYD